MSIVICFVTAPSQEVGAALAKMVVDQRLAACVNIIPGVQSVYRWEESITLDEEVLMMIKTSEERVDELRQAIITEHPYDLPEFIVVSPKDVSAPYAAWVRESTTS